MKKIVVFVSVFLLFISWMEDEDRDQFGFTFTVSNKSGLEDENVRITIGGIEDGEFIGTDSFTFPKILVLSNDWPDTTGNQSQSFAFYEERWNPDLAEVKAISDRAYFTIELEGEESILLYDNFGSNQGELVSFQIPEDNVIKNDFGRMDISFESDTVLGDLFIWD